VSPHQNPVVPFVDTVSPVARDSPTTPQPFFRVLNTSSPPISFSSHGIDLFHSFGFHHTRLRASPFLTLTPPCRENHFQRLSSSRQPPSDYSAFFRPRPPPPLTTHPGFERFSGDPLQTPQPLDNGFLDVLFFHVRVPPPLWHMRPIPLLWSTCVHVPLALFRFSRR